MKELNEKVLKNSNSKLKMTCPKYTIMKSVLRSQVTGKTEQ